jgi:hypothetical protein
MSTYVKGVRRLTSLTTAARCIDLCPAITYELVPVPSTDSSRVRLRVRSEWDSKRASLRGYDKCLTTKARGQIVNLNT